MFGQVKCGEKDFKCQRDAAMSALKADPKNPENYYNIALVFQKSGWHKEAAEGFMMYVNIPGVSAERRSDGYNNLGISHRALKQPDLAYEDYTKAIELVPTNPAFFVNRGNASVDLNKADEALADYEKAISIDPKYDKAYAQRGILYNVLSRGDEALKDLSKAIELDPSNAEPYYNRGTLYFQNKQFAKAIPDLSKYILVIDDPVYLSDAYVNRGISYALTEDPEKALNDLSKAIELSPNAVNIYKARAVVYRALGNAKAAEADEQKATELSAPQGKSAFDYAAEGSLAFTNGKYADAIEPYQKALNLEKKNRKLEKNIWFLVVDNLAMSYGISGDIEKTRSTLEYGISQEPSYPMFYYIMANTYGEEKDEVNSIKWLRLAFERRGNMIKGETFPDPLADSSFKAFIDSETFKKAVLEMKAAK